MKIHSLFQQFFCYRIAHQGLRYSSMLKKLNTANIQFSCSKNTIFSSTIIENRFQMSPRFHSSRLDCDVFNTYWKCGLPQPLVLVDYCWFLRRKSFSNDFSTTWCWRRLLQWLFPHIVATEPSRSLRINTSMQMLLSKHRSSKLSKQVMNLPCVCLNKSAAV